MFLSVFSGMADLPLFVPFMAVSAVLSLALLIRKFSIPRGVEL